MSSTYDDSKFGVTQVLSFSTVTGTNTGGVCKIIAPVNMYITELGIMVSTLLTGDQTVCQISDQSSSAITLLSSNATRAVGILLSTGALTISLSQGSSLIITNSVALVAGAFRPYIKYQEYYS